MTPRQAVFRERVESLIRLAAPALDLVLAAGERVSQITAPEDSDYYPVRPGGEASLPSDFAPGDGESEEGEGPA